MLGLSLLGMGHTAVALLAVLVGGLSLLRYSRITHATRSGRLYVLLTLLTCLTGFGIFAHGGFGKAHGLALVTLLVLGSAWLAGISNLFGRASRYVETIGYSTTYFLHFIPGFTETLTRLPVGRPLASDAEDPLLKALIGGLFVLLILGIVWQIKGLRLQGSSADKGAAFE